MVPGTTGRRELGRGWSLSIGALCAKDRAVVNASVIIIKSDGTNASMPIAGERLVVGRDKAAGLRIPVPSVSRRHCEFFVEDESVLVIRDLGSSNGTFVNRERIEEAELDSGDLVSIGSVVLAVQIGDADAVDPRQAFRDGIVELGVPDAVASASAPSTISEPAPAAESDPLEDSDDLMAVETTVSPPPAEAPADLGARGNVAADLAGKDDPDGSSFIDFDFEFDDDDDDQPSL